MKPIPTMKPIPAMKDLPKSAPLPPESADVRANLGSVTARIAQAAAAAGRATGSVTLVAVTKTHPLKQIRPALEAGQRVFGENRVQEARAKWPALRAAYPDIELHLIGPLQTNKVREAVALFDAIETLDRPKLAAVLAREMALQGRRPNCYVEVNIGAEPQKSGIAPDDVPAFLAAAREIHRLPIVGLMCIPPQGADPAPYFKRLADLARRSNVPLVSMGMSDDFEAAVRAGATHVRVGSAIFGPRRMGA
jgi:PLP dependent protein